MSKQSEMSKQSDGYHTFDELYAHRHALFLALVHHVGGWCSRKHHDGTGFDGWFIAGVDLPTGTITYHLPDSLWTAAQDAGALVVDSAPEWDGHTSQDVIERLLGSFPVSEARAKEMMALGDHRPSAMLA